ncbi:MAG TPA: hypothetical protein V6D17_07700, partial [Candidatus Obscuribacterales bacterium]
MASNRENIAKKRLTNGLILFASAMVTACLLTNLLASDAVNGQDNVDLRLSILHTNDLHAHSESFLERGRLVGGLA